MKITRRQAREITLCLVFDFGFNSEEKPDQLLDLYIRYFPYENEMEFDEHLKEDSYISEVYFGVAEKITQLDEIIKNCSLKWKFNRISRVSLSILRIAVFELLYMKNIPTEVSINEAVEISKKYDNEDSFSFINGVLGAVVSTVLPQHQTPAVETVQTNGSNTDE